MEYNSKTLTRYANKLNDRAQLVVTAWTIGMPAAGLTAYLFFRALGAFVEGLTRHPITLFHYEIWWLFDGILLAALGLLIGYLRGQQYFVEAAKILCMVEQEKHLRFIAERLAESKG